FRLEGPRRQRRARLLLPVEVGDPEPLEERAVALLEPVPRRGAAPRRESGARALLPVHVAALLPSGRPGAGDHAGFPPRGRMARNAQAPPEARLLGDRRRPGRCRMGIRRPLDLLDAVPAGVPGLDLDSASRGGGGPPAPGCPGPRPGPPPPPPPPPSPPTRP